MAGWLLDSFVIRGFYVWEATSLGFSVVWIFIVASPERDHPSLP
jgi:hypothetical protein